MKDKKKRDHYIDNEKFYNEMRQWKRSIHEAEQSGEKTPPITPYIGECFLKIAEHFSMKPNFAPIPYKDEMISDAVENCVMYAANFDPEKGSNPFSYFTQIIYYAFLRRIQREKKQNFIKYKMVKDKIAEGSLGKSANRMRGMEDGGDHFAADPAARRFDLSDKDIENFTKEIEKEDKRGKSKKPRKRKSGGLEEFLEEPGEDA